MAKTKDPEDPRTRERGLYWREQLDHATEMFKKWTTRGEMVVSRYRDERTATEQAKPKFNILWSNVEVLSPSLYGRPAKPQVGRRYKDQDPAGRLASLILERALEYEVEQFPSFDATMSGAVEDRLLPGRGTAWLRLDTSDIDQQSVDKEYSPVEYVYWKDFLHSPARTWDEVWWVARAIYLTKAKGLARFGKIFDMVPLTESAAESGVKKSEANPDDTQRKEAKVWEIWDIRSRTICWVCADFPAALDEKPDTMQLEGFFPCPKPLFATTTRGTLIPIPDYCEYQDQAEELDVLTGRISKLAKAIKAVGVFNKEFPEVGRMLNEGIDNKMFPVQNWAALAEKGGLEGNVMLLDLTTQLQALGALYTAREQTKQTIYEICGISDIVRGATKADETLGAQKYKVQFGSLRLRNSQVDVARFAADIFKLKAQIMCKFYPPELLVKMSGVEGTTDGKNPELLAQAQQLLQNSTVRDFRIVVESDSLAQIDEEGEKDAAVEAITAISALLKEMVPMVAQAPETLPMASEILLFGVRRFRAGRGLEAAIEQAMKALQAAAMQRAMNPPPPPEMIEAQAKMESDKMRAMVDTQSAQMKAQFDKETQQSKLQQEAQLERMKAEQQKELEKLGKQVDLAIATMQNETEWYKAQLQAVTQLEIAQIGAKTQTETTDKKVAGDLAKKENNAVDAVLPDMSEKLAALLKETTRPKKKKVLRDKDNFITGIEEETSGVN